MAGTNAEPDTPQREQKNPSMAPPPQIPLLRVPRAVRYRFMLASRARVERVLGNVGERHVSVRPGTRRSCGHLGTNGVDLHSTCAACWLSITKAGGPYRTHDEVEMRNTPWRNREHLLLLVTFGPTFGPQPTSSPRTRTDLDGYSTSNTSSKSRVIGALLLIRDRSTRGHQEHP